MDKYLKSTDIINWEHPIVSEKAEALAEGCSYDEDVAKRCFEFVRDVIRHSYDYKLNPVTCRASDVLMHGTGFCYAKSHLLTALLRANGIPAGLCYQRLAMEEDGSRFCLHGLNAVYLDRHGWYRVDARGDKPGITTRFDPPQEVLAYSPTMPGEMDMADILSEPLELVVNALVSFKTYDELYDNLPDMLP